MFGCPLYIHNTRKACFVTLRGCPYAPYILMPPYVWMAHHMFGCPPYASLYVWTPPYVWMPPVCLDTPIGLDAPIYSDDVWIPPVHVQHKESMLCQTKGVSICPNTFGCSLYICNTKKACFVRLRGVHMPPYI